MPIGSGSVQEGGGGGGWHSNNHIWLIGNTSHSLAKVSALISFVSIHDKLFVSSTSDTETARKYAPVGPEEKGGAVDQMIISKKSPSKLAALNIYISISDPLSVNKKARARNRQLNRQIRLLQPWNQLRTRSVQGRYELCHLGRCSEAVASDEKESIRGNLASEIQGSRSQSEIYTVGVSSVSDLWSIWRPGTSSSPTAQRESIISVLHLTFNALTFITVHDSILLARALLCCELHYLPCSIYFLSLWSALLYSSLLVRLCTLQCSDFIPISFPFHCSLLLLGKIHGAFKPFDNIEWTPRQRFINSISSLALFCDNLLTWFSSLYLPTPPLCFKLLNLLRNAVPFFTSLWLDLLYSALFLRLCFGFAVLSQNTVQVELTAVESGATHLHWALRSMRIWASRPSQPALRACVGLSLWYFTIRECNPIWSE